YLSSSVTLVQEEVRPDQRVTSGALLLLVMNLIGMGLGPAFVGATSDFLRASHPHNSLQLALYALLPFYGVAILLFLVVARLPPFPRPGGVCWAGGRNWRRTNVPHPPPPAPAACVAVFAPLSPPPQRRAGPPHAPVRSRRERPRRFRARPRRRCAASLQR